MPYDIQKDFLDPADGVIEYNKTKPTSQTQSIARMNRETTITKEDLDCLWNALVYTRATISGGRDVMGKLDCFAIHKGRVHQSNAYLEQAIKIVNQLKGEF